ncbi:MAG: hypothetical protein WCD81_11435 [Candidatus Bathyarchaeia archaeon]
MSYQVSAGTAALIVIDWQEIATSAFTETDSWKVSAGIGYYVHPTRVYGKYHQYALTCIEQGVTWANSAVPYLFGIQSAGTAILLQCNHPFRPLNVSVVVAKCTMNPPFEAGQNIRKFIVDFREYITP